MLRVVDELQRLAREEVESRGGRIVKFIGDAALATFDSANTALQEAFSEPELAGFGPVKLKGVPEPMWLYVVGAAEGSSRDLT